MTTVKLWSGLSFVSLRHRRRRLTFFLYKRQISRLKKVQGHHFIINTSQFNYITLLLFIKNKKILKSQTVACFLLMMMIKNAIIFFWCFAEAKPQPAADRHIYYVCVLWWCQHWKQYRNIYIFTCFKQQFYYYSWYVIACHSMEFVLQTE